MGIYAGANLTATYTTLTEGNTPSLGDVFVGVDDKRYRFVLFDNGAGNVAAVAGNFAYVLAVSGASAGQTTTVTMDLSDSAEVGAGVFQSVPADGEYCWVQISGFATLTTALTAGADGDNLTPTGSTDGTLDAIDTTSALTANAHVCAIAIDASAKIVLLTNMG
ncbi:MAG: hypothetical protein RL268_480 [Pseudomonadota bacterium]|jgi:hypothetical protein